MAKTTFSTNLSSPISVKNPHSNIDHDYGPYNSIAEACDATLGVNPAIRAIGKTVGIIGSDGAIVEYWWKEGITDDGLVVKGTDVDLSEYVKDVPEKEDALVATNNTQQIFSCFEGHKGTYFVGQRGTTADRGIYFENEDGHIDRVITSMMPYANGVTKISNNRTALNSYNASIIILDETTTTTTTTISGFIYLGKSKSYISNNNGIYEFTDTGTSITTTLIVPGNFLNIVDYKGVLYVGANQYIYRFDGTNISIVYDSGINYETNYLYIGKDGLYSLPNIEGNFSMQYGNLLIFNDTTDEFDVIYGDNGDAIKSDALVADDGTNVYLTGGNGDDAICVYKVNNRTDLSLIFSIPYSNDVVYITSLICHNDKLYLNVKGYSNSLTITIKDGVVEEFHPAIISKCNSITKIKDTLYFTTATGIFRLNPDQALYARRHNEWVELPESTDPTIPQYTLVGAANLVTKTTVETATFEAGKLYSFLYPNSNTVANHTINGIPVRFPGVNSDSASTLVATIGTGSTMTYLYDGSRFNMLGSARNSDADTDTIAYNIQNAQLYYSGEELNRYQIGMQGLDGRVYPLSISSTPTATTANRVANTIEFDLFGDMLYYSTTAVVQPNTALVVPATWYRTSYTTAITNLNYTFNDVGNATTGLPFPCKIYLKGTVNPADNSYTLDNTDFKSWYTHELPSTDDGFVYVEVVSRHTAAIWTFVKGRIWQHKNGGLKEIISPSDLIEIPDGVEIINSLSSDRTDAALSAAQGKSLNDTKLNKTTYPGGSGHAVYVRHNDGTDKTLQGTPNLGSDTVVVRDVNSRISVGAPADGLNAANKNYVDTEVAKKASLDAGGHIPLNLLPDIVLGQVIFGGVVASGESGEQYTTLLLSTEGMDKIKAKYPGWNATGTIRTHFAYYDDIADDVFGWQTLIGMYFISKVKFAISDSGGRVDCNIGDWLISTGEAWECVDNTDAVTMVNGKTGSVALNLNDIYQNDTWAEGYNPLGVRSSDYGISCEAGLGSGRVHTILSNDNTKTQYFAELGNGLFYMNYVDTTDPDMHQLISNFSMTVNGSSSSVEGTDDIKTAWQKWLKAITNYSNVQDDVEIRGRGNTILNSETGDTIIRNENSGGQITLRGDGGIDIYTADNILTHNDIPIPNANNLNVKLDKVTTGTSYQQAYVKNNPGTQTMINIVYQTHNEPYSIVQRNADGAIYVATPTNDNHATTKKYVDDRVSNKISSSAITNMEAVTQAAWLNGTKDSNTLYIIE
jgi:hypothetical protein